MTLEALAQKLAACSSFFDMADTVTPSDLAAALSDAARRIEKLEAAVVKTETNTSLQPSGRVSDAEPRREGR
jgi:hypothetical protein